MTLPVRPFAISGALLLLIVIVGNSSVLLGHSTFFLRDIGTTHRPAREVFSVLGYARTNPFASFGQPYLGNPNLLIAYPFPKPPRLIGLYVFFHLVVALIGMTAFLRLEPLSMDAAFFGAIAFVLSGYVLSATCSLNALTSISWMPGILFSARYVGLHSRAIQIAWLAPLFALFLLSGEPVLIALTLSLLAAVVKSRRAAVVIGVALFLAVVITLPVHLSTWRAAMDSERVVEGFSFERATSASLHPARLLETIFPYLFGSPARIGPGTFWGFAVSNDNRPYADNLSLGFLPLLFSIGVFGTSRRVRRRWLILAVASLLLSMGGHLPGAQSIYNTLPPLHVVRFPIKFFLVVTFAVSVLAAHGLDSLVVQPSDARARRRVAILFAAIACSTVMMALIVARHEAAVRQMLARWWWRPEWHSAPDLVLAPITGAMPGRLILLAALAAIAAWSVTVRKGVLILQVVCLLDLIASGREQLPTLPSNEYERPSALVTAVKGAGGRLFERAGKDLDAVILDLHGDYSVNDVTQFGVAQALQGWSLYGVRHGLRYAYDRCPDGSYTERNVRIERLIDREGWFGKLKWLRANGVASVIASDLPRHFPGLRLLAIEKSVGVPVAAYEVIGHRSEVRRSGCVWARDIEEAIQFFEAAAFDEGRAVVLESTDRHAPMPDTGGNAEVLGEDGDQMIVRTAGPAPAVLFVARSYTRHVRARSVEALPVYPANAHLIGVLVPAGATTVTITF